MRTDDRGVHYTDCMFCGPYSEPLCKRTVCVPLLQGYV